MRRACDRGLIAPALRGLAGLGLALALYGLTEAVGGYGLLAVFAAGFTFRRYEYGHAIHHGLFEGAERSGTILELLVLLLVGAMLTGNGLAAPGVAGWRLTIHARAPPAISASAGLRV